MAPGDHVPAVPDRFAIEARLGEGAMGVVYRAVDRERGVPVALKLLRSAEAAALYRFKQEFRGLSDVAHPNLVTPYELVSSGDDWFLTMELVDGVDFLRYVEGGGRRGRRVARGSRYPIASLPSRGSVDDTADTLVAALPCWSMPRASEPQPRARSLSAEQLARLRGAARQLASGVAALHAAGRVHRDLKPSNVLVAADGRLAILDFGVATELEAVEAAPKLVGTPAYMAPEQGLGHAATEASDWYAVGTMLYEALTGFRPFPGVSTDALAAKLFAVAPRPSTRGVDVPRDLDALCAELLARDPEQRPSGAEVLARLGADDGQPVNARTRGSAPLVGVLGREPELAKLHGALDAVRRGAPRVVLAHGPSGVGKSALIQRFLAEVEAARAARVVTGRCYERETLRYKALDPVVDALTRELAELDHERRRAVAPRDAAALSRLFPVVRELGGRFDGTAGALPPAEQRLRGFEAMRALLRGLTRHEPLVIHIDDAQWGDADSAALLAHVLDGPRAPAVLVIASYRQVAVDGGRFVRGLAAAAGGALELAVEPLSPARAAEVAQRLLGSAPAPVCPIARTIARESAGNPCCVTQLARFVIERDAAGEAVSLGATTTLEAVLARRLEQLPAGAAQLFEPVVIAGRPVPQRVVAQAAGLMAGSSAVVAALRSANLLRTGGGGDGDLIECCHDQLREAALSRLAGSRRREHHARLAHELVAAGESDPELLWYHFEAAGDTAAAASYAPLAAAAADDALAFERASMLYRRALELRGPEVPDRGLLSERLGGVLSTAGRRAEAARAFLDAAAARPERDRALELRRRAAESYLLSGHIDDGATTLDVVLRELGLPTPRSPRAVAVQIARSRAALALRGFWFRARERAERPSLLRPRVETCRTAALGFAMCDHLRGTAYQALLLRYALRSREPRTLARALALEAAYRSIAGPRGALRARAIADRAEALAARAGGDPVLRGWPIGCRGLIACQLGDWRGCLARCAEAEQIMSGAAAVPWELTLLQLYQCWSLFFLGRLYELARRIPVLHADARARGDLYSATCLATGLNNVGWLVTDDVDRAREVADDAHACWSRRGFHLQHYWYFVARVQIELYAGSSANAWEIVSQRWPQLERVYLSRIAMVEYNALQLRGRAALAAAMATGPTATPLRAAIVAAARLRGLEIAGSAPAAAMIDAGVQTIRGRDEAARAALTQAEAGFRAAAMPLHAAVARWRLAELGGSPAAQLGAARAWFRSRGVARPDRIAAMLAPGAWVR